MLMDWWYRLNMRIVDTGIFETRPFLFLFTTLGFPSMEEVFKLERLIRNERAQLLPEDERKKFLELYEADFDDSLLPEPDEDHFDDSSDAESCSSIGICCLDTYFFKHQGGWIVAVGTPVAFDFADTSMNSEPEVEIFWIKDDRVFAANERTQQNIPHLPLARDYCDPAKLEKAVARMVPKTTTLVS